MTERPSAGLFTRYILEEPLMPTIVVGIIGLAIAWHAMREGRMRNLYVAIGFIIVAAAIYLTGFFVQTDGEKSEAVVRAMVEAAVKGDTSSVAAVCTSRATIHIGSEKNPGRPLSVALDSIADNYTKIRSNRIRTLEGVGVNAGQAYVDLACVTETSYGPTPSHFVVILQEQSDGAWQAHRIVVVSIGGEELTQSDFRF